MSHERLHNDPVEVEALFVIPDIGGYTRFMLASDHTQEYAQRMIRELMEAMLKEKQLPLRISEIEGDALFLYAVKEDEQWDEERLALASTIENFFVAFESQLRKLLEDTRHADLGELSVKVIVHAGRAMLDRLDRFTTITGVDAIIAHRLLKNSLSGTYLLVTKPAFEACQFPQPERFVPHEETYDDVGTIECYVYQS